MYAPLLVPDLLRNPGNLTCTRGLTLQMPVLFFSHHDLLLVKQLMYGFGDVPNPSNDAVSVMEDMLIEYLTDTVRPSSIGYEAVCA